jgi:hypothetical protein
MPLTRSLQHPILLELAKPPFLKYLRVMTSELFCFFNVLSYDFCALLQNEKIVGFWKDKGNHL